MSRSFLDLWMAWSLLCMAAFLHLGNASVQTWVQAGPLYRMAGSRLSISCNVSGFASATSRKEFEFRVTKPAMPSFRLNIISTADPSFGYAQYRARGPDIALMHFSPNSVLFEIKSLQQDDEGEYDCSVINPEYIYDGTYSVKTTVKVINDSLSVSSDAPASLHHNEGELLALTCRASSNTIQHTHLSVGWYLQKEGDAESRLILSLDRDFTLRPGPGFLERYQANLVRLDKVGEAVYRLTIDGLEPSDSGRIYCRAQEWIEDPDLTWFSLTQKTVKETVLDVKGKELAPDKDSVVVRLSAREKSLQEGQELLLTCSVDTHNPEEKIFSVAWLQKGAELAQMGPTGVLSVRPEYSQRETRGELRATRIKNTDHRLVLQYVSAEDQGEYMCRVWPQKRGPRDIFVQGQGQDSNSLPVSISATVSEMSLEMQNSVHVNEGDKLTLACKARGFKGQLFITWQRKVEQKPTFSNIIGLSQEGVVETMEDDVAHRIRASRSSKDTFVLEINDIMMADSGVYQCEVSETNGHWKTSKFVKTTMTVAPIASLVDVKLRSRNTIVTIGDNVELMCHVKGPHLAKMLTWSLQRGASPVDNILTMYSDGAIRWSGEQQRYHLRVDNAQNESVYYLFIHGASHRETGSYQCQVSVFQNNVYKQLLPSNQLLILVQNPASDLILTPTPALTKNINSDITIQCSVASSHSGSSRFAITWILQQETRNVTILKWDRDSSVTVDNSQRFSMKQTMGPNFELTIRDSRTSDGGFYVCEVVEWLQDPHGEWYHLPAVAKNIQLTLIEPAHDLLHPAHDLLLDVKEQMLIAKEGDKVQLKCDLISDVSSNTCFYKVTWFYAKLGSSVDTPLLELNHFGLLRYSEHKDLQDLLERLRLSRPNWSSFGLEIQRVHQEDSGMYRCRVEQYQLGNEGKIEQLASAVGSSIVLSVNSTGESESRSGCASGMWISLLVAVALIALF